MKFRSFTKYYLRRPSQGGTRRAVNVARIREMRNAHEIFIGKTEGNIQRGRNRRIWENIIRMDLRETG